MAFGRPLQISLVGGSLASIAFRALEEAVGGTGEIGQYIQQSCPVCIPDEVNRQGRLLNRVLDLLEGQGLDFDLVEARVAEVATLLPPRQFVLCVSGRANLVSQFSVASLLFGKQDWLVRPQSSLGRRRGTMSAEGDRSDSDASHVSRPFALNLVYHGGSTNFEYEVGTLSVGEEPNRKTVAAIFVSECEGKVVTALPHKAWDRKTSKRSINTPFSKAALCEVLAASSQDRAQPAEFSLKIWVGLLSSDVAASASFEGPGNGSDVRFLTPEAGPCLPFADALVQVSDAQFGFATAHSPADPYEARFAAIEASISKLTATFTRALGEPTAAAQPPKPPRAAKAKVKSAAPTGPVPGTPGRATEVPGLDPALYRAAVESGIKQGDLAELQGLLAQPKHRLADFPAGGGALASEGLASGLQSPAASSGGALDEPQACDEMTGASPVEAAVLSLTKIVKELAKSKKGPDQGSSLERALDRAEGFGAAADSSVSSSGGRSKAAAYRILREALTAEPVQLYTSIERLLEEDLLHRRLGSSLQARWAELCLHRVRELEAHLEAKRKLGGKNRQPHGDAGPGASFLARPRCDALLSAAARGWDRIAQSVSLWDSAEPVDASAMGRTACKVERIEGQLRALATVSPSTPRAMCEDFNLAKDIEVNRLSLPSSPPSFDPSPFLDDTMRSLYLSPSRHAWPIDEAGEVPPRVQCRIGTKQEKLEFLSALDQSGRLELFPADQFDARTACGLFALPKGLDTDRLIVDARPSNLCVPTDVRWLATMASASSLLGIELDQDQRLFLSGEDIKDFYHQFRITVDRAAYYRIAGFFRPSDLSHLRSFKPSLLTSKRVVAALRCMAMGDCNAVSVGQSSHLGLILAAELVGWHQLLTMRGPVPRSPCMLGLVIDDAIVIEKALRCQTGDTASLSSQRLISGLHSAYLASKLPRHEKKSFFAAEDASFWGSDVLGELGRVRPAWARLIPLVSLTVSALNLPLFTVSLLEVLAGSWISVLAFRRRTLCLLEHIYLLQRGHCRTECVRATPELKAELFRLCVLAPLLHTDLRAQTSGLLLASDASDSLGAFVTTRVTKVFSRELQRHTPARGLWNKLLSPVNALLRQKGYLDPNLELPGEVFRTHPLWTTLVRSLPFKLRAVFRRRKRDHINIKEMDSYIAAEESLAPFDWESARTLAL
ncbi:unnamed protein product, partial [Symbiodinium microadriaticum]